MKSSVRTDETFIMRVEEWTQVVIIFNVKSKYLFIQIYNRDFVYD